MNTHSINLLLEPTSIPHGTIGSYKGVEIEISQAMSWNKSATRWIEGNQSQTQFKVHVKR